MNTYSTLLQTDWSTGNRPRLHERTDQILRVSRRINAFDQPQDRITLINFIEAYLMNTRRSEEYKQMYRGVIYNLEGFCRSHDIDELYTDEMTEMFAEEFIYYLKTKGLMLTTIKGLIERTKAMLKKASNYGYPIHHSFDDVNVKDEDSNAVYLSIIEITRIYYYQGLTEECLWERTVGLHVIKRMIPKWQMVTSHTARRSTATNMFLAGIPTYRIMLLTGHTSEKSFFKYVRVTRDENAAVLSGHIFFQ